MNSTNALSSFLSTADLSPKQLNAILTLAQRGKQSNWRAFSSALAGRVLGLLFFNPSLRTRTSFQSGIARLGAQSVVINAATESWALEFKPGAIMNADRPEHVKDACAVLSACFDALCVRAFPKLHSWAEDKTDPVIQAFKQYLTVPLISMESSLWHPCQALADALTLREAGQSDWSNRKFVLCWTPHPKALPMAVPNSSLLMAAQQGFDLTLACPSGYELDPDILAQTKAHCAKNGRKFEVCNSASAALKDAKVVYAKSWTPPELVGQWAVEEKRRADLGNWMITKQLMKLTDQAHIMHCLPVRRNVEVTDEVLDSTNSLITLQAANRMHAQNALLLSMLTPEVLL